MSSEYVKKELAQRIVELTQEELPNFEKIEDVGSDNHNGNYELYRLADGSVGCTCLSFLFQRGCQTFDQYEVEVNFTTCKHIREHVSLVPVTDQKKLSDFQLIVLRIFGVDEKHFSSMTHAQGFFVLSHLLDRQDLTWDEFKELYQQHGKDIQVLPCHTFGVEFEHFIPNSLSTGQYATRLTESGTDVTDSYSTYHHRTTDSWKVMYDATLARASAGDFQGVELVSPKLYASNGLRTMRSTLSSMKKLGASTKNSKACGTHVHIDAYGWEKADWIRLGILWLTIEKTIIHYLVSPSRRDNVMCKPLTAQFLAQVDSRWPNFSGVDRYMSVNAHAFTRHKTVEFRLMNGVLKFETITPWVIFLLKLTDAVKNGFSASDLNSKTDLESLLDQIGMGKTAVPLLYLARKHLLLRFEKFKQACGEDFAPESGVDVDSLTAQFDTEPEELPCEPEFIEPSTTTRPTRPTPEQIEQEYNRLLNRATIVRVEDAHTPTTQFLATYHTYRQARIPLSQVEPQQDGMTWIVRAARGTGFKLVTVTRFGIANESIECNCQTYRRNSHCNHSQAVARVLMARRTAGGE